MDYICVYSEPIYFRPDKPEDGLAFSKSTCIETQSAAPETPLISATFTEGEIMISLLLFFIFLILFTNFIYSQFIGMKLKAKL